MPDAIFLPLSRIKPRLVAEEQTMGSIYSPLDWERSQISVLVLLPGACEDTIRCELSVEPLETKFEALSYVWGDAKDKQAIEVEEQTMMVIKNLEQALRHVLHLHEVRQLWVDAVCINQQDLDERNHQVWTMDEIYRGAERVVVWLGLEGPYPSCLRAIQGFGIDVSCH